MYRPVATGWLVRFQPDHFYTIIQHRFSKIGNVTNTFNHFVKDAIVF